MVQIGIVGLPNVGKSTLFNTLIKKSQAAVSNYPFCTIEPNVGIVPVPDERLIKLAKLSSSLKTINATVKFVDIAGLVENAHKGEGLGNQFLSHIREVEAILYVLRAFQDTNIANVMEKIDPVEAKKILDTELILKDLETVTKRTESLAKDAKRGIKEADKELPVFKKINETLNHEKPIRELGLDEEEGEILKKYQFLTAKPCLYLINGRQSEIDNSFINYFKENKLDYLIIDAKEESELCDMSLDDREALGASRESGLDVLIKKAYKILSLITFFTTGPEETRAWTVHFGAKAPEAAGVIHTDFEKGFIRADTIGWQKLLDIGSWEKARERGLIRSEGKDYVVSEGDVMFFKFSG
jgi:GTP-binding protein YchF